MSENESVADDAEDADGSAAEASGADESAEEAVQEGAEEAVEEDTEEAVEEDAETEGAPVEDDLRERVESADSDELAREIAELRDRVDDLEAELDDAHAEAEDLESRLKRKQADFQNYKKRMEKRREEEKQRATEDLVERLLDVRDNLQRALETDEDTDIRDGVEATLRQFDRVLDAENVVRIDPDPGGEVDPQRHEVLMRVASDREPGTIDEVHRPGYEMADKVLRPAQVTVAEAGEAGQDDGEDAERDEGDDGNPDDGDAEG